MASKTYTVSGMTCAHCVNAVSTEIGQIAGITDVGVDLESGQVTVTGEDYTDEQIAAAVDEAGYTLTSA